MSDTFSWQELVKQNDGRVNTSSYDFWIAVGQEAAPTLGLEVISPARAILIFILHDPFRPDGVFDRFYVEVKMTERGVGGMNYRLTLLGSPMVEGRGYATRLDIPLVNFPTGTVALETTPRDTKNWIEARLKEWLATLPAVH